ncbi:hypothetical protein PF002_g4740 [Phytophthora fragariae]|nr:hypothetical protein PF009_g4475 [Phytophthora fragariae]KAE9000198.1 hypothetical protein PF011_g14298 [Phytophthora fragariae]KAE9098927.1 hypothetical protein PF007_g16085 [Phytophthora fragariae]KAE9134625.1 hypothetical protein PF006_g14782 [Phytophthora fragariae]KAE9250543.1 hypothetical protein PF002_g4740 [Phytophthora fragariae]
MQASFTIKAPSRPPALKSEVSARRLSKTPPTPERRPSIRQSAFVRGVKRLARRYYEWKSAHQYLGRYTVDKLLALEEYQRVTSPLRVFAVIALTPLPGLLAITLIGAIPLESPLKGVSANASYFVQSALAYTVMTLSLLFFIRGALGLPQSAYSHRQCILIGILTAGCNELAMLALSIVWAFPLPFRDFLGIPTFFTLLTATHVWMLRSRLRHYYRSMLRYIPLVCAQASILFIFQGLAILFANVPQEVQGVITITFPLLRAFLKRMIWTFAGCLDDISTDVTICVVEIFGSLFQNVCVQNARSPAIGALIIVVDFAQALVEVYMYLNHKFVVDGSRAVSTAVRVVESSLYPTVLTSTTGTDPAKPDPNEAALDISHRGNSRMLSYEEAFPQLKKTNFTLPKRRSRILAGTEMLDLGSVDPAAVAADPTSGRPPLISPASVTGSKPPRKASVDDIDIAHRENAKLLKQTLQLLFASEVLVFAEYAEFACSVVYGLYTLTLYHMPYAKYNLSFIGLSETQFWKSVGNTAVYCILEGCTLLFLFTLMRGKYGMSTLHQLAFVLEKYWMSVQGKMCGSLSLIFILNTVHHGMVLSLKFNCEKVLNGTAGE